MAFRGFTEAKHKDGALNDLETRVKNTFNQVKNSRILGGNLLSGVKLKSTASSSSAQINGVNRLLLTVDDYSAITSGVIVSVRTSNTFRTGTEGSDWDAEVSNNTTATNIADHYQDTGSYIACKESGAVVEFATGIYSVLQSVSYTSRNGFTTGTIDPCLRVTDAIAATLNINEPIRFGPASLSAPSDLLPGVSRVMSKAESYDTLATHVILDGFPSTMRGSLYAYKLLRNPIPGVGSGSKYMILNQDRPSNIWSGAGGGSLSLSCDNDCTVDMWVF